VFLGIAIGSAAAGVILLAIAPVLQRMTHGAEAPAQPVEAGAAVPAG
jgi:hypothetical protein